jgi:hypothetical protein
MCIVGSLVMQHPGESTTSVQGSILFGTVSGAIGSYDMRNMVIEY